MRKLPNTDCIGESVLVSISMLCAWSFENMTRYEKVFRGSLNILNNLNVSLFCKYCSRYWSNFWASLQLSSRLRNCFSRYCTYEKTKQSCRNEILLFLSMAALIFRRMQTAESVFIFTQMLLYYVYVRIYTLFGSIIKIEFLNKESKRSILASRLDIRRVLTKNVLNQTINQPLVKI